MDNSNDSKNDNDDSKQEQKESSNLWRSFLKTAVSSGGRGLQSVGHLIVLGSPSSGKTTLVGQFGKLENKFGEMKKFLMMRYSYVHITSNDQEDSYSLLNIWQIAEPEHSDVLTVVIPKDAMDNVAYLICLDLSKPANVENEYKKWMNVCTEIQNKLISRCKPKEQEQLKTKLYSHIQFYTNPKDDTEDIPDEEKKELEILRTNPSINIGAPVLVVANKCDAFRKHFQAEADAEDHFEIMCSYIRLWCLEYGATSFCMKKGLKEQARRILSYIDHRIFDKQFDRGPNAVVKLSNLKEKFLFIPSGFDSIETIKDQNPNRDLEETKFAQFFKPKQKKKKQNHSKPTMQADINDKFLKRVEFELKNGGSSKPSGSGSTTRTTGNDGVDINDFFQRLLDPSQKK